MAIIHRSGRLAMTGAVLLCLLAPAAAQDDFIFEMRDATKFRGSLKTKSAIWQRVGPSGISSEQLNWDSVQRIDFARNPASRQLSEVRNLLTELQSDNYHARNEAEAQLVRLGRPFIDVLTAAQESDNPEVRYRLGRILKRLQGKEAKRIDAEYDRVALTGGESAWGDVEFDVLQVVFAGRTLELSRDLISSITRGDVQVKLDPAPAKTRVFSKPDNVFYRPGDTHVNFDVGRLNESFNKLEDISQSFVYAGVRLSAIVGNDPATVIAAGYAIDQSRSKKNSAATMVKTTNTRFLGTLRIDFCEPGQEAINATVHRVGCYIALVNNPRDFVMEAYTADGQIVATAEALEKSAFMGVESEIPIAYVLIQSNQNLKLDPKDRDPNFVIDDLTFDVPQATPAIPAGSQAVLWAVDGGRFWGSAIEFDNQNFLVRDNALGAKLDGNPLVFAPREVRAITFAASPPEPRAESLWGFFTDGTYLPISVNGQAFTARDFDQWTFDRSALAGVCGGSTTLRFPLDEDLESKKDVAVFPAERWLIAQLHMGKSNVSWNSSQAELREIFSLERSSHSADTTSDFALADAPSIWWQAPSQLDDSLGCLRTRDGRAFTLGGSSQIAITKLDRDGVTLSRSDQTLVVPWKEIVAIKFPLP